MMILGSFIFSYEKIPHAQKAQKGQKAQKVQKAKKSTFFILDVFIRTKSTRRQTSGFFLLDVFYAHKNAVFLFLLAYVRFVLFIPNKQLSSS